jgi:hypothetical protein
MLYSLVKVLLTVSPFLPPSTGNHLCFRSVSIFASQPGPQVTPFHLLAASCFPFALLFVLVFFVFYNVQPLFRKTGGWCTPSLGLATHHSPISLG